MKFKDFLNESSEDSNIEKIISIIKEHCTGFKSSRTFWRGSDSEFAYRISDTSKTTRRSAHTDNYYTLLLDENSKKKGFPLRSKSYIVSNHKHGAMDYGDELYVVIPFDDAKVGRVPQEDIWFTPIKGTRYEFKTANDLFKKQGISDESYEKLIASYKKELESYSGDDNELARFIKTSDVNKVEERLLKLYDPIALGFKFDSGKNYTKLLELGYPEKHEHWIDGKMLMISERMYKKVLDVLNK